MSANSIVLEQVKEAGNSPQPFSDMMIMSGFFNLSVLSSSIRIMEEKMCNSSMTRNLISRTKLIGVEILENIIKHQDDDYSKFPFFKMYVRQNGIEIQAGNQVSTVTAKDLKSRIDKLESLSIDEIKRFYIQELSTGSISSEGNAGLGLITIYKRSNKNVRTYFRPIDDQTSYFTLEVKASL